MDAKKAEAGISALNQKKYWRSASFPIYPEAGARMKPEGRRLDGRKDCHPAVTSPP
jgi:hypothetical protein